MTLLPSVQCDSTPDRIFAALPGAGLSVRLVLISTLEELNMFPGSVILIRGGRLTDLLNGGRATLGVV